MTKPTHLIGPMAAVLAVGSHDDNLLKVRDFWKRELRKSASRRARPPSGKDHPQWFPLISVWQHGSDHTQEPRDHGLILSLNPRAKVHSLIKSNILLITQNKAYAFFEGNIFQTEQNVHAWVRWRATQRRWKIRTSFMLVWAGALHSGQLVLNWSTWNTTWGCRVSPPRQVDPAQAKDILLVRCWPPVLLVRKRLNGVSLSPPLLPPQELMWLTSFLISSSSGFSSGASA